MLLPLLDIQPLRIRHIFCLIRIVGIVMESQIVHFVFQFYFNLQLERYIEEAYNIANLAYPPQDLVYIS